MDRAAARIFVFEKPFVRPFLPDIQPGKQLERLNVTRNPRRPFKFQLK